MSNLIQLLPKSEQEFGHQGDVFFKKVANLPPMNESRQLQVDKTLGVVLQHGEGLGHYHRVDSAASNNLMAWVIGEEESIKEMAMVVKDTVTVVHDEHSPVTLSPGFWIAKTQRETFQGLTRKIVD